MYVLSLSYGNPLAIIHGGELDNEIIYLKDLDKKCCKKHGGACKVARKKCCNSCACHPEEKDIPANHIDWMPFFSKWKKYKKIQMIEKMQDHFENDTEPIEEDELEIYMKIKQLNESLTDVKINGGRIQQLPNMEINEDKTRKRDTIVYFAQAGAGKSYQIKNYCQEYMKIYPKHHIYVFSPHKTDAYDGIKNLVKIVVNEDLIKDGIDIEEVKDSVVILDDCDSITDKKTNEFIWKFREHLLTNSRHTNTNLLITSHVLMTGGNKNKTLLQELTHLYVFPQNNPNIDRLLTVYVGLSNMEIKRIKALKSRWVCISKNIPKLIMYESGLYLL